MCGTRLFEGIVAGSLGFPSKIVSNPCTNHEICSYENRLMMGGALFTSVQTTNSVLFKSIYRIKHI